MKEILLVTIETKRLKKGRTEINVYDVLDNNKLLMTDDYMTYSNMGRESEVITRLVKNNILTDKYIAADGYANYEKVRQDFKIIFVSSDLINVSLI